MEPWDVEQTNYPPELRERAVRMVAKVRPDYPSDWPAICAVASRLGVGSAETLPKWVGQASQRSDGASAQCASSTAITSGRIAPRKRCR